MATTKIPYELIHTLENNAHIEVVYFNDKGEWIFSDNRSEFILSMTREEILNTDPSNIVPPLAQRKAIQQNQQVLNGSFEYEPEKNYTLKVETVSDSAKK